MRKKRRHGDGRAPRLSRPWPTAEVTRRRRELACLGLSRTKARGGGFRILGQIAPGLPEVRCQEGGSRRRRRCRNGTVGRPLRGREQRGQVDERPSNRYGGMPRPGVPRPGTAVLQLVHLRVRAQDPLLRRTEVDKHGDPLLDADHPAEPVHVVCDPVAHGELLGNRSRRRFEGTGRQVTLRCTWLCHCPQYAPPRIRVRQPSVSVVGRRPPAGLSGRREWHDFRLWRWGGGVCAGAFTWVHGARSGTAVPGRDQPAAAVDELSGRIEVWKAVGPPIAPSRGRSWMSPRRSGQSGRRYARAVLGLNGRRPHDAVSAPDGEIPRRIRGTTTGCLDVFSTAPLASLLPVALLPHRPEGTCK